MSRSAKSVADEPRPTLPRRRAGLRLLTLAFSGLVIYTAVSGLAGLYTAIGMHSRQEALSLSDLNIPDRISLVFALLSVSFYALICAVRGDCFRSPRWWPNAVAAVVLAVTAIVSTMAYFYIYPVQKVWQRG